MKALAPVVVLLFASMPLIARAQVGSGAPQASAHVQVQTQADDSSEPPHIYPGQALDRDVAVLSNVPPDPLLKPKLLSSILRPADRAINELRKTERLSFGATYTVVNQYATVTPEGIRHNWGTGRFDLVGGWKAYDHGGSSGSLSLLVRSGTNIGVSERFNLSDSLGSGLVLNCLPGGGPQRPITLNVLYYRQDFFRNKFAFYIGKIHRNEFIS